MCNIVYTHSVFANNNFSQGDQIGRIFAYRVNVYIG
jgi:hypothetical protein